MTAHPENMSEPKKFVTDIIWMSMSQLIVSGIGFVTMPLMTKTYSTESYGIWTLVNATVGLAAPVLTMQLGSAVIRFLSGEDDKEKRRRLFGATLSAVLISTFLVLFIASIFTKQISQFLFNKPNYITFTYLTIAWTCTNTLFTFLISDLRSKGKLKKHFNYSNSILSSTDGIDCNSHFVRLRAAMGYREPVAGGTSVHLRSILLECQR